MTHKPHCPYASDLRRFLAGDLPQEKQPALATHLPECPECLTQLNTQAHADELIEAARDLGDDPSQADEVLKGLIARLSNQVPDPEETQAVVETLDPAAAPGGDVVLDFLAASDQPQSIGRLGDHEIVGVIGSGGMGIVLKAESTSLRRVDAIKVLKSELAANAVARRRFVGEAQKAAAVTHDHVVTIHAVDEANGLPYIVMEYILGVSLEERIRRTGPLKVEEILRIGMQAAAGLSAAHGQGLIHRDIKPANILLENGVERVKIADFGLARAIDDAQITNEGAVAGTPAYMSPEQASDKSLDARSDLFSLGSVMYAMCTGRPAFRADNPIAAMRRVCDDTPRPISEVNPAIPEWLVEIVEKLQEKNPDDRFQSASELEGLLQQRLADWQYSSSGSAIPAARKRQQRTSLFHRSLWIAISVCSILLVGLFAWIANIGDQPSSTSTGEPSLTIEDRLQAIADTSDDPAKLALVTQTRKAYPKSPEFWWHTMHDLALADKEDLALAAHEVVKGTPATMNPNRLQGWGIDCRGAAKYLVADHMFTSTYEYSAWRSGLQVSQWALAQKGRVRGDFHHLEIAEKWIREARDLAKERRAGSFYLWADFELATILACQERHEEAKALFESVATAIQERIDAELPPAFSETLDRILRDQCSLASGLQVNTHEIIEAASAVTGDNAAWAALVMAMAYEREGEIGEAVNQFQMFAENRYFDNETFYAGWTDERLLQLLLETTQETRAVQIFGDLVTLRDEKLPAEHPERAYTRMLLAEAMIAAQQDLTQIPVLLDEARQIFERYPTFTPKHAWQRIETLRARARSE